MPVIGVSKPGGAHIIGRCQSCKEEHSGLLVLALEKKGDDVWIEIGVDQDGYFHPLETLSLKEYVDNWERGNEILPEL